jgi:NADH-quinone oxidoreductase subunit F
VSAAIDAGWDGPELIRRVTAAGLRGRGGGWFSTGRKWQAVRAEGGDPFVIANGHEGEPGSVKDRQVMAARPGDVLRGLALAARAVGAREGVVFIKSAFEAQAAALQAALDAAPLDGPRVRIVRGAAAYVAGEETAILEALEGRQAWPRAKPPVPAGVGFEGRPTLVHNVETLARVPAAVADPEAFRRDERTLVSVWGHVRRPGVHEVPLGLTLRRLIDEHAGGASDGLGLIFPAGPSGAPLVEAQADTPLDPDALRAQGSALGTAAVLVIGRSACPLAVGLSLAAFFEREACGQCPPCTVGTAGLARVLRALESGGARAADLRALQEVAGFMQPHGYCAHARTAATSVTGLVARVPAEIEAHLAYGRCPRPDGRVDPFAADSPERSAVEATLRAGLS